MSEAYEGSRRCINCDAVLTGAYCAECGQDNRARRLGFRAISADLSALLLNLELLESSDLELLDQSSRFVGHRLLSSSSD